MSRSLNSMNSSPPPLRPSAALPAAQLERDRAQAHQLRKDLQRVYADISSSIVKLDVSLAVLGQSLESSLQAAVLNGAVQEHRAKLQSDAAALKSSVDSAREIHTTLLPLDASLLDQERHLTALYTEASAGRDVSIEQPVLWPHHQPIGRESNLPQVVEQYFDKVGDVKLLEEKLDDEMPNLYYEQLSERELRKDQDDKLTQGDSEFEASWARRTEEVREQMVQLQQEAEMLKQQCIAAGHNIDPLHYLIRSENNSSMREGGVEKWLVDIPADDDSMSQPLIHPWSGSHATSSISNEANRQPCEQDLASVDAALQPVPTVRDTIEAQGERATTKFQFSAHAASFRPHTSEDAALHPARWTDLQSNTFTYSPSELVFPDQAFSEGRVEETGYNAQSLPRFEVDTHSSGD